MLKVTKFGGSSMADAGQYRKVRDISKTLLQYTQVWRSIVLGDKSLNSLAVEQCEDLDIALSVVVAHVQPELVELIRRCVASIEPYITRLCLTKLRTVSLGNKRAGDSKCLSLRAELTADKLSTCCDITPLICTTELNLAVVLIVEVQEDSSRR